MTYQKHSESPHLPTYAYLAIVENVDLAALYC